MLGDSRKAQEVFHATLREAAVRAARGELPSEPFWLFRDARWRCLEATKSDLQPEPVELDERDVAPKAESQIQRLDPIQLAIWISAAPDPQRSALLRDFDRVLGLSLDAPAAADAPLPEGATELLERRAAARAAKDWSASDRLRDELTKLGVDVRDTASGQQTTVRAKT